VVSNMQRQLTFAWVIITYHLPWGKYQYKRLPMGVKTSPDIFQRIMYELLGDIPNIQVYLEDILITSNGTFEEHAEIMQPSTICRKQISEQIYKNVILVNPKLTI
jgi:hypothetical protein